MLDNIVDLLLDKVSSCLALACRRKDICTILMAICYARKSAGELPVDTFLQTKHGRRAFSPTDRIFLTENNNSLGIRNGMLRTIKSVTEETLEILLDGNEGKSERKVVIYSRSYSSFDHGYATTVHKSQGATVDRSYVLGFHLMDRHLFYVAMTRHKQDSSLCGGYMNFSKMRRSGMSEVSQYIS